MWLGKQLEDSMALRFVQETGMKVQRRNAILQHPDHPWMLANVDRLIVGRNAGLEIKTTSLLNRTDFASGDIPPYYYCQCLHYMAVTGADEWHLAVAVLGKSFHVFHISRNQQEIDALVEAERIFWQEHVQKQIPPPPDGSAAASQLIKTMFPSERRDGVLVPLFGDEAKLQQILELDRQIRQLEKESDALKQAIQIELGEADGGKANGFQVWWRSQQRASIDSKRLQQEKPDVYQQYARTTTFRKFEIKLDKGA
jgi:predicted phage-related endonuclease